MADAPPHRIPYPHTRARRGLSALEPGAGWLGLVAMVSLTSAHERYFDEYRWSWAVHQLLPYIDKVLGISGAMDFRPINVENDIRLRIPLVVICMVTSSKSILTFAHVVNVISWFYWMPAVWDHMCWVALTESLFIACALVSGSKGSTMQHYLPAVRTMLIILYFSAAFWKLTTSFLDPLSSCANTLVAELAAAIFEPEQLPADSKFAHYLMLSAPAQVVFIEFLVPFLLWLAPRSGIVVALLFHFTINCMPVTYAGGFSIAMCVRLLVFLPGCLTASVEAITSTSIKALASLLLPSAMVVSLAAVYLHCHDGKIDASGFAFLAYCLLYLRSILNGYRAEVSPQSCIGTMITALAAFVALLYGFAAPVLGVMAMASSTMYGNLIQFGGQTNHLLLPTGLLQNWYRDQGPHWLVNAFGGGMVRLENASSSLVLNRQLYGADISADQPQHAKDILAATHSSGVYFELYASRNYFERDDDYDATALTSSKLEDAATHSASLKFAMPAYELRRLLDVARHRETDYALTYARIPPTLKTVSEWHTFQPAFLIEYRVVNGVATCAVVDDQAGRFPCDSTEIAQLPPPPVWLRSFLHPYPIPLIDGVGNHFICTT